MNVSQEIIPVGKHKLVFLGDQSVGKTSIINRFVYNLFDESSHPTVGIDFISKTIETEEHKKVRLQLWDTAGQERFRTLIPNYIRGSAIAVIVYDITNRKSFESVRSWNEDVRRERGTEAFVVILANKSDLNEQRVVSQEEGSALQHELDSQFFQEVSAKKGQNIQELFKKVASILPSNDVSQMISSSNFNNQNPNFQNPLPQNNNNFILNQQAQNTNQKEKNKKKCC